MKAIGKSPSGAHFPTLRPHSDTSSRRYKPGPVRWKIHLTSSSLDRVIGQQSMQFYPVSILVVKLRLGIKSLAGNKDTTRLSWVLCMLKTPYNRPDVAPLLRTSLPNTTYSYLIDRIRTLGQFECTLISTYLTLMQKMQSKNTSIREDYMLGRGFRESARCAKHGLDNKRLH